MRGAVVAAVALGVLGAGGLGFAVARSNAQSERIAKLEGELVRARAEGSVEPPPPVVAPQPRLDPRDLDAIAERAAAIAAMRTPPSAAPSAGPAAAPAVPPAPLTPEQQRSLAAAGETLDDARARGVLRRADVEAIRASLRASGVPDAAAEMGRRIAVAINAGELKPEDPRAIFP